MSMRARFSFAVLGVLAVAAAGLALLSRSGRDSVLLSSEKQDSIWRVEHFTFELEQKLGSDFKQALKARDAEAIRERFRDGFTAQILATDAGTIRGVGWWSESASDAAGETTDAEGLLRCLLQWRDAFETIDSASFRVLSLQEQGSTETGSADPNWRMTLLIAIAGQAADGRQLSLTSIHEVDASFSTDEQIISAPIVTNWRVESVRTQATQPSLFTEVTQEWGLTTLPLRDNWQENQSGGQILQVWTYAAVADYDGDDLLDIAICSADGRFLLLRNMDGARFDDVTEQVLLPDGANLDGVALAHWLDYDNDGDPDLILGPALFRNDDGQRFRDVTQQLGLTFDASSQSCATADFDRDGWLDLYVLYDHSRNPTSAARGYVNDEVTGAPNRLWRNVGGERFEDVTEAMGVGNGNRHSFAGIWLYADDDEWPDLYVVNDFGTNALYRNRAGKGFDDVAETMGAADFATSMGGCAGDIDNDGTTEVYVANMYSKMGRRIIEHVSAEDYPPGVYEQIVGSCAGNRMYRLTADGSRYQEVSEDLGVNGIGWAYAPLLADFDADGWLDIYATTGFISVDRSKPDG